ncbi:hypothetical protein EDM80_15015 [bacterium]|nr:MAG: hypothetical protein EDM80_15015 [bacterium]
MNSQGPTPEQIERANLAFQRFVRALAQRQGTDKPAVGFTASQEFAAAFIESGAAEQGDIQITEVFFGFGTSSVALSARVKVPGKAWPPRPPVDTHFHMKLADLAVSQAADGSAVSFVVDEPLTFSSTLADMLVGLLGKLFSRMPISISDLRTRGARLKLNFTALVSAARPDLAQSASQIRLQTLNLTPGRAHIELLFKA